MEHYKETGEKLHGREARNLALPPIRLHGMAQSVFMFTQIKTATTATELTKQLGKDTALTNQSQRAKSAKNNHLSYGGKGKLRLSLFLCPASPGQLISQARKDKQAKLLLQFCLPRERRDAQGETQARKDKQAIHWPFVLPLMRRANCSWTKGQ